MQPPGSTGEETRQEIVQVVVGESGEESDGSYSEDEVFTVGLRLEDAEDEEQRLIKQGGAGIPIGPVSRFTSTTFNIRFANGTESVFGTSRDMRRDGNWVRTGNRSRCYHPSHPSMLVASASCWISMKHWCTAV